MNTKKAYGGTQAISRAIAILQTFTDAQAEWSLPELAEATGLNRTTTYRILSVLESAGLVAYISLRDKYRLGSEMIVLGARALRANPLREASAETLKQLAQKTGEMASLEILEGDQTLILDEVKGAHQRRMNTSVGNAWYAHTTSTGKALLAYLSDAERAHILPTPLPAMTASSVTKYETLYEQLERIRGQGFAHVTDELEIGLTEVAAPIFNYKGEAVAAISIAGPTIRLQANVDDMIALVQGAAERVSTLLGWRG